jgi:hypothetical protein
VSTPTIADATITMMAHAFRLGHTGEANERLRKFVDELAGALPTLGSRAQALLPTLNRILEAQERGDYAALADALEYELAPLL